MSTHRTHSAFVAAALAATFLPDTTPAQVPEGHAVVGTFTDSGATTGQAGLFLIPLSGGPTIPITGLPPALATNGTFLQGAWSVSIRDSDGALIVGTLTEPNSLTSGDMELWILHLNGTAVNPALTQQIVLGTTTAPGGAWAATLPDGRILVHAIQNGPLQGTLVPLPAGPMAGLRWVIIDVSGPTPGFSAPPNPPGLAGQELPSIAIDPTGEFVYYTANASFHGTTTGAALLRYELATGLECQIASWPTESAFGIECDDDGTIYISSTDRAAVQHFIHTVVPDGCNPATVTTVQSAQPLVASGLGLDRASGRIVATSDQGLPGFAGSHLHRLSLIDRSTGAVQVIGHEPPTGWGLFGYSLAVNNFMDSYGAPSDGQNRYWFENFPNPTDYPYVGNSAFSLHIASAPGTATASAMSLSLGRGSTTLAGIEFLLDPATAVTTFVNAAAPYALPIPNSGGLAGVTLTAQSLHLEGSVVAASNGLAFTISLLPAPIIGSISPPIAAPGATMTVDGANFYGGMELRVDGNLTPIATQSATSLTFAVPAGVQCDSTLSLTNLGGAASSTTINGTPVLGFSTASGPAAGGAVFAISGQHLTGATVTIGGSPLASVITQSASSIVGYTPPGTVGTASVVVTGPTGCQETTTYTYL